MITKAQLIEIAKELELYFKDLTFEELKEEVDNFIKNVIKKSYYPADNMSESLKEYLYSHHNLCFQDREGNRYDHKGRLIKKARKKKNK